MNKKKDRKERNQQNASRIFNRKVTVIIKVLIKVYTIKTATEVEEILIEMCKICKNGLKIPPDNKLRQGNQ